jgi:CDP-diacylglycerol--serine O-phosphatidyltransferase
MDVSPINAPRRTVMRRVVVVMPSAFTLGNLFFGIWAIVAAYNGGYLWAGWFIMFAGVLDGLDGRVARASNTGTRFGAELDSLVDVISFGVAPAMLIYFEELATVRGFAWVLCFLYVMAAAIRLARFNVVAGLGGRPSAWFTGLPSPAAGATLAVWWAFSQTSWYRITLAQYNGQHIVTVGLMVLLAMLMVSNVKYPRFPSAGIRSPGQITGLVIYLVMLAGGLIVPRYFLFPLGITYIAFGLLRAVVHNLADRNDNHTGGGQVSVLANRRRQGGRNLEGLE